MIITAILLFIAFVSLIGVRFTSRNGRWKHIWLVFCIVNLTTVAIFSIGSLKKAQKVRQLDSDLIAVREYSSVARLDALGNPPGYGIGFEHVWIDDLTRLFEDMYTIDDGRISMRRGPEAEQRYREVIQRFPKFPFGYYFLAVCLKERGEEEWREHAKLALEILKITTRIDGHHENHDDIISKISTWFEEIREK